MRVLVTGAASGIGRATCLRLAGDARARGERARVAALDLPGAPGLRTLPAALDALGAEALPLPGDLADPAVPAAAVAAALERFGGLDGLVSNAGVARPGPLVGQAVEDWDRLFAVNTRATWLLARAAHPALRASRGAVVAVASVSGMEPHAGMGAYGPSKAALLMLVRVLAQELASDGIRVNAVSPGMVRTGLTEHLYADERVAAARAARVPLGHVAAPEAVAGVIAFLLGADARYVTGANVVADAGLTGTLLGGLPRSADPARG
jgi:glucose 1-dehydrogenase